MKELLNIVGVFSLVMLGVKQEESLNIWAATSTAEAEIKILKIFGQTQNNLKSSEKVYKISHFVLKDKSFEEVEKLLLEKNI